MWRPICQLSRHVFLATLLSWAFLRIAQSVQNPGDLWPLDRPDGMPTIQSLEVMCGKDHMDVHLTFSHGFEGIVSSKGQHGDPRCVYVPPSTGQTFFSFRIGYSRCGTKADLHGQFYENTVVVQYDKDLIEVWDEAKRLRCEWFNDYEKTASKPPMVIADLDVIQLDFRGDNVDCWMEIQHGKGPWAPPVSGIVPLGSTLTLVVAINDYRGEFDMRVKSCMASDGSGHVIQLSDEFGCVLRPKMISRFLKARGADERASVITYAFFHAFKFPDALSVHIKCKVEICRHGCLDHCQTQANKPPELQDDTHPELFAGLGNPLLERKDDKIQSNEIKDDRSPDPVDQSIEDQDVLYDDIIHENQQAISSGELPAIKMSLNANMNNPNLKKPWTKPSATRKHDVKDKKKDSSSMEEDIPNMDEITEIHKDILRLGEKFPHGPRNLNDPPVAAPRSLNSEVQSPIANTDEKLAKLNDSKVQENEIKDQEKEKTSQESVTEKEKTSSSTNDSTKPKRRGRSMVVSDRKARSADVGVSGIYEVISEQDLAFSPDTRAEAVAVFQGRIMEEVVYGICMPMPGFSLLFVVVAMSAVISALVAGTLLYRYQIQKEKILEEQAQNGSMPLSLFSNWINFKLCKPCGPQSRNSMDQMDQNGILDTSLSMNSLCLNGKNSHTKQ